MAGAGSAFSCCPLSPQRMAPVIFALFWLYCLKYSTADLTCSVGDYGAKGNGEDYDTVAIQTAVDKCSQPGKPGTVVFEPGLSYLTGTITLTNSVHVVLPSTSTLLLGTRVRSLKRRIG